MLNKNIKKMLLFVTLCLLLVGIASAESIESDDSALPAETISEYSDDTLTTASEANDNIADNNREELNKNTWDAPVKTATATQQEYTYIKLNTIKDTNQGSSVNISGYYLYDKDLPLTLTTMRLNINGQSATAKTDNKGYFTYTYKTVKAGTNTVTVSYPGNTRFMAASATLSFNVKSTGPQYTYITLNNVQDVAYGASTTISGYYYYGNDIPLTYTPMRVNVNGEQVLAKTDSKGFFTYNYKTDRVGKNTVTVSYPGNANFKSATATKTFNVKITSPIATYIKLNNINEVTNGQTATISGYYYYSNDIPLTYTPMRLNINGQSATAKTDNNGYFTYSYKTNKDGSNTVTVSYPGNANFKSATSTKTFNVKSNGPQYTYIVLDSIPDVSYDDFTYISGYYYYGNNIPLTYTPMKITVNGELYDTVKTDANGYFSCLYLPEKVFKNNVTVSYHGNSNFKAASATKNFNVKITSPINTDIYLYVVDEVDLYEEMTIDGIYYYGDYMPLAQTTMRININGKTYTAKTDDEGYFSLDIKTDKIGTNNLTVSYPGNTNFKGASTTVQFKVNDIYKNVTLTITSDQMVTADVDGDPVVFFYSTVDAQYEQGVYIEIDERGLDDAPVNKLVKAVIYFKNSKGNIITRTAYPDYLTTIRTSLVDGYTPYKAVVTCCKMTEEERYDFYDGY